MKLKPSSSETGRSICPECGKVSYSRDGIHPQCSATRASRIQEVARKAKEAAKRTRLQEQAPVIPDSDLTKQILGKLAERGIREPSRVTVRIRGGTVTLSGTVQFANQKQSAVRIATGIAGVRRVVDRLTLTPPANHS